MIGGTILVLATIAPPLVHCATVFAAGLQPFKVHGAIVRKASSVAKNIAIKIGSVAGMMDVCLQDRHGYRTLLTNESSTVFLAILSSHLSRSRLFRLTFSIFVRAASIFSFLIFF